jgi:L-rhamnose isomerase/sugar isomerase
LLAAARLKNGGAINPIQSYRNLAVRETLIKERGKHTIATGL